MRQVPFHPIQEKRLRDSDILKAGKDTCPECSILEPVQSWPDLDAAPVGRSGPCGYNARVGVDYNQPSGNWGTDPVATYEPGQTVDVQWCVDNNGDHGGMFSYRICEDQNLVDKLLTPGYLPTEGEKQAAEDCFEAGTLSCTDVGGNDCGYSADCSRGQPCWRNDWFTCKGFGDSRCKGVDGSPQGSCATTISGGYTVSKKIKIPDFSSEHTLLSFKWNSFETGQIYLSCADIAIRGAGTPPTTTSGAPPSSTTSEVPCESGDKVSVTFDQIVTTRVGQTVKVVGSIPELGSWDVEAAPALSADKYTSSKHLWSKTVEIGAGTSFEYKFVSVGESGGVSWESDPNRKFTVPCEDVSVDGQWR